MVSKSTCTESTTGTAKSARNTIDPTGTSKTSAKAVGDGGPRCEARAERGVVRGPDGRAVPGRGGGEAREGAPGPEAREGEAEAGFAGVAAGAWSSSCRYDLE